MTEVQFCKIPLAKYKLSTGLIKFYLIDFYRFNYGKQMVSTRFLYGQCFPAYLQYIQLMHFHQYG